MQMSWQVTKSWSCRWPLSWRCCRWWWWLGIDLKVNGGDAEIFIDDSLSLYKNIQAHGLQYIVLYVFLRTIIVHISYIRSRSLSLPSGNLLICFTDYSIIGSENASLIHILLTSMTYKIMHMLESLNYSPHSLDVRLPFSRGCPCPMKNGAVVQEVWIVSQNWKVHWSAEECYDVRIERI